VYRTPARIACKGLHFMGSAQNLMWGGGAAYNCQFRLLWLLLALYRRNLGGEHEGVA